MSCRCKLWFRFLDLGVMKCWLLSLLLVVFASRCGASVAITTTSLPNGTVNTAYSAVINASRGCTPYKWAIASGGLPAGITSNVSVATTSLTLAGTPTTAATYSFAVKVTGCGGHISQVSYRVIIQDTAVGYLTAPSGLNLGSVTVGSSQTQALIVSNSGGSSLTISGATVSGTGFSVSGLAFPYTLPAGSSANLSVTFAPSTTGTDNATLFLSSNASDPSVGVALTGSGTTSSGNLGVAPGSLSFGSVTIGTTQTQSGSVTASGGSVTLSSASSSNSAVHSRRTHSARDSCGRSEHTLHDYICPHDQRHGFREYFLLHQFIHFGLGDCQRLRSEPSAHCRFVLECEHVHLNRGIQRVSRNRKRRAVLENQFCAGYLDELQRQHGSVGPNLLLRDYCRRLHRN